MPHHEITRTDLSSKVEITATLPGTEVFIDGRLVGTTGTTPLSVPVADGSRLLQLRLPDGRETSLTIFVQDGTRRVIDPASLFAN